ncbi:E3 ubiquitin-protein ligase mib1-like [Argopecten irradians]|uniref:E3 ubiquitin-protein ligase mib1-like n=1 Tax=Argopecten irradians TaxID=31199 RepID=UPI003715EEB3
MGAEDSYDLRSVDEPRFLPEGMLGAVGVSCRRGPDWEWDNQDGGEDQVGIVFKIEDSGVIHVRWQNGKRGNYRYGIHGKFDIEMW